MGKHFTLPWCHNALLFPLCIISHYPMQCVPGPQQRAWMALEWHIPLANLTTFCLTYFFLIKKRRSAYSLMSTPTERHFTVILQCGIEPEWATKSMMRRGYERKWVSANLSACESEEERVPIKINVIQSQRQLVWVAFWMRVNVGKCEWIQVRT